MRALLVIAIAACSSSSPPTPAPNPQPTPPVAAPTDGAAPLAPARHTIAAGSRHVCARTHDAHVACWGELGNSSSITRGSVFFHDENPTRPVRVEGLSHVVGLEAGGDERCAWTETGEVWCWGKVGTHDGDVRAPRRIAGVTGAIQVAGGALARMMCALLRDGHVVCWGDPDWSGDAPEKRGDQLLAPSEVRRVPEVNDALEIAVAFDHACARLAIGTVVCWEGPTPGHVVAVGAALGAISLDGGASLGGMNTFAALLPGGHATLWTLPEPSVLATPATLPADATTIAVGGEVCVRGASISCWTGSDPTPHAVPVDRPIDFSQGGSVACARLADGTARCWGERGLLGDGAGTQAFEAADVPGLAGVTSVAIDGRSTCAVASGHVYCWGARFAYLRKNDLDYPEDAAPVEVPGIANAIAVRVESSAACAQLAAKRVVCWGDNRRRTKSSMWLAPTDVPDLAGGGPLLAGLCVGKRCLSRDVARDVEPHHARLLALPGVSAVFGGGFARESWTCVATKTDVSCLHTHYGHNETDFWPENGFENHAGGREVISVPPGAGMCIRYAAGTIDCIDSGLGSGPYTVPGIDDAIALGHGPNYGVCALRKEGAVMCWPEELRQIHRGPGPWPVPGAIDAIALASGPDHACIVKKSGAVACWGAWALVGRGTTSASPAPSTVAGLAM